MNLHTTISRKHWLTLIMVMVIAALLITTGILFAANQTPRPDVIVLQEPPAPEQERIFAQPADVQEAFELPPVEKEPLTYPNMDSHLNKLVEETESTRRETTSDAEQTTQSVEPVLVTFYVLPEHINALREYLEANGVFVRNVGDDYIEAHVPPLLLSPASEQPGVLRVDTVIPPRSTQSRDRVISQGVGLHGADAWHNADYRGRNVKVGVIDLGFEGFSQLQGGELPNNVTARCYFDGPQTPSSRLADCEVESNHGTAVAETVADVAPDIELYISNPYSLGDLRNAVDWMVGQGVQIINVSLGYPYDGPGDGTSPSSNSPLKTIDVAASNGIVWVNAAGNDAQRVWHGTFTDPNDTGIHHFATRDVGNVFRILEGDQVLIFMRWDDTWGQADCDLDLQLYESKLGPDGKYPLVSWDPIPQDGSAGKKPFAIVGFEGQATASQSGLYFLVIRKYICTDNPAWIQLTAWIGDDLQYYSPGHHMGNPEESRNPGMLAVGATHYWNTSTIAAYSSHGPTMDGRTKPDITGIACGRTVVYPSVADDGGQCWFRGTSQAAPHVAGLAALIRQRFPDYGPRETVSYLQQHASDRGTAGADNTWGHGLATLPAPEVAPTTEPVTASGNTSPTSNIAVGAGVNAGEVVISWDAVPSATHYRIGYVNMEVDYHLVTEGSCTMEPDDWIQAFVYVDVKAPNIPVRDGHAEYTIRRLSPGALHAFTVLTSNNFVDSGGGGSVRSEFFWPSTPRWSFLEGRDSLPTGIQIPERVCSAPIAEAQPVAVSCSLDDYDRNDWGSHPSVPANATATWTKPSDNVNATDLTNDHHVALADAHVSGGCVWSTSVKDTFSSDTDNLNPTTRSFNSSKANRTPDQLTGIAERIIDTQMEKCDYAIQHEDVKEKYDLSLTEAEQDTVDEWLALCP